MDSHVTQEVVTIQFQTIDGTRMMARISMMEATKLTSALKQVLIDYLKRDGVDVNDDGEVGDGTD